MMKRKPLLYKFKKFYLTYKIIYIKKFKKQLIQLTLENITQLFNHTKIYLKHVWEFSDCLCKDKKYIYIYIISCFESCAILIIPLQETRIMLNIL